MKRKMSNASYDFAYIFENSEFVTHVGDHGPKMWIRFPEVDKNGVSFPHSSRTWWNKGFISNRGLYRVHPEIPTQINESHLVDGRIPPCLIENLISDAKIFSQGKELRKIQHRRVRLADLVRTLQEKLTAVIMMLGNPGCVNETSHVMNGFHLIEKEVEFCCKELEKNLNWEIETALRDNCRELYKELKNIDVNMVYDVFMGFVNPYINIESFLTDFLQRHGRLIQKIYPLVQESIASEYSRSPFSEEYTVPVDWYFSSNAPSDLESTNSGIILTPLPKKIDEIPNALSSKKRGRYCDEFLFTSPNKRPKSSIIPQPATLDKEFVIHF